MKEFNLADFVENPDNPQTVTDEAFDRLVEKLRRVPDGLSAMRIAYVTDHPAGKFVVVSGNKRLRALKVLRGAEGTAPADWFQDVTGMSEDERNEFIVDANVVEGKFDPEKMIALYTKDEMKSLLDADTLGSILAVAEAAADKTVEKKVQPEPVAETVEFVIELSTDDYADATEFLRARNKDISKAFAEVIHARA